MPQGCHGGHLLQVVQVFVGFRADHARGGILRPSVGREEAEQPDDEHGDESARYAAQAAADAEPDRFVVDVVSEELAGQDHREQHDREPQPPVAGICGRLQSVPGGRPLRDYRRTPSGRVGQVETVHRELRPREERPDGHTQQQRPEEAVDEQEGVVGALPEDIRGLSAVFVGHCLHDETEQNGHPDVDRAAERRGVEQRERGEERPAERHERSKRKLPLPPRRVDYHLTLLFRLAQTEYQRIATLHEQQENKYSAQQGYYKPPVLLKKYIGIHVNYKLWIVNYEL